MGGGAESRGFPLIRLAVSIPSMPGIFQSMRTNRYGLDGSAASTNTSASDPELETVGSIGQVIKSMQTGADATVMFDDLKNGLAAPIAGMSISFTSSLFGLAGSLVIGFLDLQAGQAQSRFYTELEDRLSAQVVEPQHPETGALSAASPIPNDGARAATAAMANLAEGIQGLVQHMRKEQQMIRDWVEAQAEHQRDLKKTLERLVAEKERE